MSALLWMYTVPVHRGITLSMLVIKRILVFMQILDMHYTNKEKIAYSRVFVLGDTPLIYYQACLIRICYIVLSCAEVCKLHPCIYILRCILFYITSIYTNSKI